MGLCSSPRIFASWNSWNSEAREEHNHFSAHRQRKKSPQKKAARSASAGSSSRSRGKRQVDMCKTETALFPPKFRPIFGVKRENICLPKIEPQSGSSGPLSPGGTVPCVHRFSFHVQLFKRDMVEPVLDCFSGVFAHLGNLLSFQKLSPPGCLRFGSEDFWIIFNCSLLTTGAIRFFFFEGKQPLHTSVDAHMSH